MTRKIELLQELKNEIKKSSKAKYICILYEEQIVNQKIRKERIEKTIETNGGNEECLNICELDGVEFINDIVNCDTCQEYNYTISKQNNIQGYIESTIVICKLNINEYKVDIYMKLRDNETNIEYETNKQYKILLTF